jgi:hypothetical protein
MSFYQQTARRMEVLPTGTAVPPQVLAEPSGRIARWMNIDPALVRGRKSGAPVVRLARSPANRSRPAGFARHPKSRKLSDLGDR